MGIAVISPDVNFGAVKIGQATIQGDVPISALAIAGDAVAIGNLDAAKYNAVYTPTNTTERSVAWSIVSGSSYAEINAATGKLTILEGADEDSVTIRVTSSADPDVFSEKTIVVSYQADAPTAYITDGLIAHFDAIDKANGDDSWKWGDLISGNMAGSDMATVFGAGNIHDYAEFTSGNYMKLGWDIDPATTNYTIEVCYSKTAGPQKEIMVLEGKGGGNGYIAFATWGTNGEYIITGRNSNEQKCFENSGVYPQTCSVVNQLKCIINGTQMAEVATTNYLNADANKRYIAAGSNGANPFTGKIYSIRVYNRALSDAEIANNQAYDVIRFGL